MASLDNDDIYIADHELLAIFDDTSTLSHLEDLSLDPAFLRFISESESANEETTEDRPNYVENNQKKAKKEDTVFLVPKVYTCIYCMKRFYSRLVLRRHQVYHAKQQLRCPWCGKRSYSINILLRHFDYFHFYDRKRQLLLGTV
ncbi:uncharacterized protein LOC144476391 [Augochlora pura]